MKVLIKATNEIKEVKDTYAVSYLIPKGLAVLATEYVLSDVRKKEAKKQQDREALTQRQAEMAKRLQSKTILITAKANTMGELFGSIGKQQIKKALNTNDPVEFKLDEPIKKIGVYLLELKIGKNKIKVTLEVKASQIVDL